MAKRLPRNAAPIPFPTVLRGQQTVLSTSPGSYASDRHSTLAQWGEQVSDIPTRSPSSYSEIEVVLEDGMIQKRTVSLSTIPEPQLHSDEDSTMEGSDENAAGRHSEQQQHQQQRPPQEPLKNPGFNSNSRETTPLLRDASSARRPCYGVSGLSSSSSSTTTSDTDSSDTPFFPAGSSSNNSSNSRKKRYRPIVSKDGRDPDDVDSSLRARLRRRWHACRSFKLTNAQRNVLKCSFAYFFGSLFTFVPALNSLIGNNRVSSHLVATATVFFNPAKSLGGMVEAAAYGWGYTLFALTTCLGSMITTDFFIDRGYFDIAHTLSLFIWLAGPTFVVAFLKAHWNKPPVATASSLCFIIIFIIVVREGSANHGDFNTTRIEQITSAVATGTVITVSACILIWPSSAAKKLNKDLDATLTSYRVLLKLLTKTFLLDEDLPEFTANKSLQTAIESHRSSFTALQKSLSEAKLEVMWNRQVRGRTGEYEQIVKSMQRLAQHVGGLRSSCGLQFERMSTQQQQDGSRKAKSRLRRSSNRKKTKSAAEDEWNIRASYRRRRLESEMRRQKTMQVVADADVAAATSMSESSDHYETDDGTALIEFIRTIRQPLKSLAYTCKQTIYNIQFSFVPVTPSARVKKAIPTYDTLEANLEKAIALFEVSQRQAVQRLHQRRTRHMHRGERNEEAGYAPGEDVFLVYFFVFNMIEFARELITLVQVVREWSETGEIVKSMHWWQLFAWKKNRDNVHEKKPRRRSSFGGFVPNESNTMNTLHTPEPTTTWRKIFLRVWRTFSLFKLQKVRYATKATVATVLLALPAFLESTANWFREWRMEWALITLMVVMTPTSGLTNLTSIYRIFSTALGCFMAMAFYMVFPANMYVLPILAWLFSIPNFWLILNHKHGKFGQFTLLAFNLVLLNKYNDRETNTVEVWRLAFQRCVAILIGVVFGLFATNYVWPFEARSELRKQLSDFLLRMAWLYQKLVSMYSERPDEERRVMSYAAADGTTTLIKDSDSTETLVGQRQQAKQMFQEMELGLQRTLLDLQALLAQTPNEPRLKGSFPVSTYKDMLMSCQNIVDKFLSMRAIILKDAWFDDVQRDFIMPVSRESREMVGNVLLYFYLLASALRLKTPLPPYFPPARSAWQSLISRLRQLPVVQSQQLLEKEHVYVLYYAYVTMMEDIVRDLDKVRNNREGNDQTKDLAVFASLSNVLFYC
ncbi:Fusaric acid resistance protein-like-domain-containing protein [Zychaea mexicana]|uniref:Fusaric acid resistance protein-like-domain-containing protein n=1 Tax=Zychaea mexicana TaxID=64656 RepID=UPI0022FF38E7|nr:Fusaric acid resistance protein-like-domain-containing protein [Zychaea mexicana]KAI9496374.1 Fusaric acid resistance protein-like-domain-containing protein [Zychaea mexicana]